MTTKQLINEVKQIINNLTPSNKKKFYAYVVEIRKTINYPETYQICQDLMKTLYKRTVCYPWEITECFERLIQKYGQLIKDIRFSNGHKAGRRTKVLAFVYLFNLLEMHKEFTKDKYEF